MLFSLVEFWCVFLFGYLNKVEILRMPRRNVPSGLKKCAERNNRFSLFWIRAELLRQLFL